MEGQFASGTALLSSHPFHRSKIELLEDKLDKFFRSEDDNHHHKIPTAEEQYCEEHFLKTTTKDADGRFVVMMPFKVGIDDLGTNFGKHRVSRTLKNLDVPKMMN